MITNHETTIRSINQSHKNAPKLDCITQFLHEHEESDLTIPTIYQTLSYLHNLTLSLLIHTPPKPNPSLAPLITALGIYPNIKEDKPELQTWINAKLHKALQTLLIFAHQPEEPPPQWWLNNEPENRFHIPTHRPIALLPSLMIAWGINSIPKIPAYYTQNHTLRKNIASLIHINTLDQLIDQHQDVTTGVNAHSLLHATILTTHVISKIEIQTTNPNPTPIHPVLFLYNAPTTRGVIPMEVIQRYIINSKHETITKTTRKAYLIDVLNAYSYIESMFGWSTVGLPPHTRQTVEEELASLSHRKPKAAITTKVDLLTPEPDLTADITPLEITTTA
jgi:hypothetical protein